MIECIQYSGDENMQVKCKKQESWFLLNNSTSTILILIMICIVIETSGKLQCLDQNCMAMHFYGCTICYQNCLDDGKQSNLLLFKSCKQINCTQYGQQINRDCLQFTQSHYNQSQCLSVCCNTVSDQFNTQIINQCLSLNQQNINTAQTQKIIVIVSVVGSIFLCCIASFFCSKNHICSKLKKWIKSKCYSQPHNNNIEIINNYDRQIPVNPHFNIYQYRKVPLGALLRQSKWADCSNHYINKDDQCSICLQNNNDCFTYCNHNYHFQCLLLWISKKSLCPVCNTRTYNPIQLICQNCHQMKISISIDRFTPQLIFCNINCPKCQKKILRQRKRLIQINQSSIKFN